MFTPEQNARLHLEKFEEVDGYLSYPRNTIESLNNNPPEVFLSNRLNSNIWLVGIRDYYEKLFRLSDQRYNELILLGDIKITSDPVRYNPWVLKSFAFEASKKYVLLNLRDRIPAAAFDGKTSEQAAKECNNLSNLVITAMTELRFIAQDFVITDELTIPTIAEVTKSLSELCVN